MSNTYDASRSLAQAAGRWYDQDYNCAEAMLRACDEQYDLAVSPDDMRLAAGLGGGVQIKEICGALTGAVLACGKLYVRDRAHESEVIKTIVSDFLQRFSDEHGTLSCDRLRDLYHTEQTGCRRTIELAAQVFEQVVADYEAREIREQRS
jgi:C_GCAxxG_C_C family probable redox protein